MSTNASHTAAIEELVADALRQLEADGARLGRALRATPLGGEPTLAALKEVATARRHALSAFGRLLASADHPVKPLALQWLSLVASGLTALHTAIRTATRAPATSAKQHRIASDHLRAAQARFLEIDRALGCPHGCRS